jgi:uncharacterized OB-fold protein
MKMAEYLKQVPAPTSSDKAFWEAAKQHVLTAYHCKNCGTYYSQPTDCIKCNNPQMEWGRVSGKGWLYTFGIYHQLYHPAWKGDIPYTVAWVQLDEGPILMTNIIGCKNEDLQVEMPVEVVFDDITEEFSLPKFRPIKSK